MSQYDTIRFVRVVFCGRYHHFGVKLHIVTDIKVKQVCRNITNIAKSSKFYCKECSSTYSCALKCMIWTFCL